MNSVINDDITVIIRDSTGVSHRQDDEIRMVSMITVDVSQGHTNSQNRNSREIRDHVTPVSVEKQDSAAHRDIRLGGKYSLRNLTVHCFGGCDLTHRLNRAGIDWCWICIDRLIWGYHVSCLVAIVNKDRTIGRCMSIEGSGVCASTRGLEDITAGRDSRSVRFVVPDGRIVDRSHHDVTVVDIEEEREPMVVLSDMTRLRELWPVEVFDHMKRHQQDQEGLSTDTSHAV